MKNTYLLIGLLFISIMAVAQEKKPKKAVANLTVKTPVLQSFNQKFPEGIAVSGWEQSPGGNFIAHFEKEGFKQTAEFKPDGSWVKTKVVYAGEQLPEAVQHSIKEKYPDAEIDAAEKLFLENIPAFYKVSLKKDKDGWIVWVNETGIIKE